MTACANKRCSIVGTHLRAGIDDASFGYREGGRQRMALRKIWKEIQSGSSGSWMRTSETFSGPLITKNFSRW